MLNEKKIQDISSKIILVSDLSDEELLEFCIFANQRYRTGNPIITDEDYDFIFIYELAKRIPNNPFLNQVETENDGFSEEKVDVHNLVISNLI